MPAVSRGSHMYLVSAFRCCSCYIKSGDGGQTPASKCTHLGRHRVRGALRRNKQARWDRVGTLRSRAFSSSSGCQCCKHKQYYMWHVSYDKAIHTWAHRDIRCWCLLVCFANTKRQQSTSDVSKSDISEEIVVDFCRQLTSLTSHRPHCSRLFTTMAKNRFVDLSSSVQVFHTLGTDLEAVGEVIEKCVNFLVEENTPHTIVFSTGRAFLLPRQHLEEPPFAVVPGFPEVSGEVRCCSGASRRLHLWRSFRWKKEACR